MRRHPRPERLRQHLRRLPERVAPATAGDRAQGPHRFAAGEPRRAGRVRRRVRSRGGRDGTVPDEPAQTLRHHRLRSAWRECEHGDPLHRQPRSAGPARSVTGRRHRARGAGRRGPRLRRRMRQAQRHDAALSVDRRRGPGPRRHPPGGRRQEAQLPRLLLRDAHRLALRGPLSRPGPGDGPRWGDGPVDGPRAVPGRTGGGLREGADQLPRRLRRADGLRLPRGRQAGEGVRHADGIDRREAAPGDARTRSSIGRAGDRRIRRPCGSVLAGIMAGPGGLARPRQAR